MKQVQAGVFLQDNQRYCSIFWYGFGEKFICIKNCVYVEEAILALYIHSMRFNRANPDVEIFYYPSNEQTKAKRQIEKIKTGRNYINKIKVTSKELHYIKSYATKKA